MDMHDNIIELIDENDEVTRFEHLLTLDYDGTEYIVITPLDPIEGVEEGSVIILRVEQDDMGNDIFVPIEDEEELQEVYEAFLQIIDEAEAAEEEEAGAPGRPLPRREQHHHLEPPGLGQPDRVLVVRPPRPSRRTREVRLLLPG